MKWISLKICLFFCFAVLSSINAVGQSYQTYTYKKAEGQILKLDVFKPSAKTLASDGLPVIILFHGGGWVKGDRTQMYYQCKYFAERGLVAITADYRLMNHGASHLDSTKEVCIRDAKSAVRWVERHAALWHIDTAKVILGGGSAGGHLATMAALDNNINDPDDDTSISIHAKALVLFNPAYSTKDDPRLEPFNLISKETPPAIMFFGSADHWKIPADTFYKKLKQDGVQTEMWIAKGEHHAFFNKKYWNLATCIKADKFLNKMDFVNDQFPAAPDEAQLILNN